MNIGFECYGLCYDKKKESSIAEALGIPSTRWLTFNKVYDMGVIVGKVSTWRSHSIRQTEILSFWAPGMFQHDQYKYLSFILDDGKATQRNIQNDSEILDRFQSNNNMHSEDEYNNCRLNCAQNENNPSWHEYEEQRNIFESDVKNITFDIFIKRGVWMHSFFEKEFQNQLNSAPSQNEFP